MNQTNEIPIQPYLEEILYQITAAKKVLTKSTGKFEMAHHFLTHCTIVHKIILPHIDEGRINKKIKGWENELRKKQRSIKLRDYFRNFTEINKNYTNEIKQIRDSLEHIDERLDDAVEEGFVCHSNTVITGQIEDYIFMEQPKKKLRNYENGNLTFGGKILNLNDAREWIEEIELYIKKNGIPENKKRGVTIKNCVFM